MRMFVNCICLACIVVILCVFVYLICICSFNSSLPSVRAYTPNIVNIVNISQLAEENMVDR